MDLLRHQYHLYSHHHPYRLSGMRYGAVSPYQVVTVPRCTCECYCERNRVQFVDGETRNLSDSDMERRPRDMDDLKNGMFQAHLFVSLFSWHYQRKRNISVDQLLVKQVLNVRFKVLNIRFYQHTVFNTIWSLITGFIRSILGSISTRLLAFQCGFVNTLRRETAKTQQLWWISVFFRKIV